MSKKLLPFLLLMMLFATSAYATPATQPADALPAPIAEAVKRSGIAPGYEVLASLVADDSYAALALRVDGQNLLLIAENTGIYWEITVGSSTALYPNDSLSMERHREGGWPHDGFLVLYNTEQGQWPYFSFDRTDYGEWSLGLFMMMDGEALWRISPAAEQAGLWVYDYDGPDHKEAYEAAAPFVPNLAAFDVAKVPLTLKSAKVMLGDALISRTEAAIVPVPMPTPSPIPPWLSMSPIEVTSPLVMADAAPKQAPLRGTIVALPKGKLHNVYSGPGEVYLRGVDGNASVSTNGAITAYGLENGYALISYTVNAETARFGYIEAAHLPDTATLNDLAFLRSPILVPEGTLVTDDPDRSARPLATLAADAQGYYLVNHGEWGYVDLILTDDTALRGFVPEEAILFAHGGGDAVEEHKPQVLSITADPAIHTDADLPIVFTVVTNRDASAVALVDQDDALLYRSDGPEYTEAGDTRTWRIMLYFHEPFTGYVEAFAGDASGFYGEGNRCVYITTGG